MLELHCTDKPYFEDFGGDDLKFLGTDFCPKKILDIFLEENPQNIALKCSFKLRFSPEIENGSLINSNIGA